MFHGCKSLTFLDINSSDTSQVTNMSIMFQDCYDLKYLDLGNFNTLKVENMEGMFEKCKSLLLLNLSNFNLSSIHNANLMFKDCEKLMILDLNELYLPHHPSDSNISYGINKNLTVCFDKGNDILSNLFSYFNSDYSFYLSPEHKIIFETYECLYNCSKDDIYKYEYNNICYRICPNNTKFFYENNSCVDIICKNNFYNYNQTECIDEIPERYYLNDTYIHTIVKCNIECGNCSMDSNRDNLCLSCNTKNNYYPKYNDSLNKNIFKCYNQELDGYFLDNNTYVPCYNSCYTCFGNGNENNHN